MARKRINLLLNIEKLHKIQILAPINSFVVTQTFTYCACLFPCCEDNVRRCSKGLMWCSHSLSAAQCCVTHSDRVTLCITYLDRTPYSKMSKCKMSPQAPYAALGGCGKGLLEKAGSLGGRPWGLHPACFQLSIYFLICPGMSKLLQPHICCHQPALQPWWTACPQTVCYINPALLLPHTL